MNSTIPSNNLPVKYAGLAVECGTLAVLLDAITQQPVLVMPLERSVQRGPLTVHQWIIHVTARSHDMSPVYFASLRAAEVVQKAMGLTLTMPVQQTSKQERQPMQCAQHFQRRLHACVIDLLSQNPHVSQVVIPARYRLPDEWIWSARCEEPRLRFLDGSWTLLER